MLAILFWEFWLIGLVFGGYRARSDYGLLASFGIAWLLFLLLGLKVFGIDLK